MTLQNEPLDSKRAKPRNSAREYSYRVRCTGIHSIYVDVLRKQEHHVDFRVDTYDLLYNSYDAQLLDFDNQPHDCFAMLTRTRVNYPTLVICSDKTISPIATFYIEKYADVLISKSDSFDDWSVGLSHLFKRKKYYSESSKQALVNGKLNYTLGSIKPAHAGVLVGLSLDKTAEQIGQLINLSGHTVAKYKGELKERYACPTDTELGLFLDKIGLNKKKIATPVKPL